MPHLILQYTTLLSKIRKCLGVKLARVYELSKPWRITLWEDTNYTVKTTDREEVHDTCLLHLAEKIGTQKLIRQALDTNLKFF